MSTRERLAAAGVVPVVVLDDAAHAPDLVQALVEGGLDCIEITLRTPAGLDALAAAARQPGALVGAGTVLTTEQVDRCADLGALFIVSPGLDEAVVDRARERGLLALPGIATPTELQHAVAIGLAAVKVFPVALLGGPRMLDALAGPFPDVGFFPSGGVGAADAAEYLAHPSVFAVGGSWMVPRAALAAGDAATVRALAAATSGVLRS